ncbi:MAG: metal-sensitive transcriptional regulator [Patescibacteria group bacterium]
MKQDIKKKTLHRLKIIEGQIRGLQRMTEEEQYCVDIITQSLAIKKALTGVEQLVMENHLGTHVVDQMKSGKKEKAVKEILSIFKLSQP